MPATRTRHRAPRRRPRPKVRQAAGRKKPPAPKLGKRPHVLVLGRNELSRRVARAIRQVGIACGEVRSPDEASTAATTETSALVIVPPIPKFSVLSFVRKQQLALPTFVVMAGPLPDATVRKLYRDGVEGVLEWPIDRAALTRTLLRVTAPAAVPRGRTKSSSEIALEETARSHLEADAVPFGARLIPEAMGRIVVLRGEVDALWKLELARQVVSSIPGVEDVIARGVHVSGQARSDRSIAEAIRQVLRHSSAVDGSTLAASVRQGTATLTGTVRNKDEASRALDHIRRVRGVRAVEDYLVVSPVAKQQDRVRARNLRRTLLARYPKVPIEVSVFGSVAVLAGRVPRAALRDEIMRLVHGQDGIQRVVDKLRVSGRIRRQH